MRLLRWYSFTRREQSNMVKKVNEIGDLMTVDEASKRIGTTYVALSKWIRRTDAPRVRVGPVVMVRLVDLVAYQPRI